MLNYSIAVIVGPTKIVEDLREKLQSAVNEIHTFEISDLTELEGYQKKCRQLCEDYFKPREELAANLEIEIKTDIKFLEVKNAVVAIGSLTMEGFALVPEDEEDEF